MDGRPDMYPHQRAEIRIRVRARALFQMQGELGQGQVRNLSAGGVEIRNPEPAPKVGTEARIMLHSGDVHLGPLRGEVVRETQSGVAFRFLRVDEATRAQILDAMMQM